MVQSWFNRKFQHASRFQPKNFRKITNKQVKKKKTHHLAAGPTPFPVDLVRKLAIGPVVSQALRTTSSAIEATVTTFLSWGDVWSLCHQGAHLQGQL